MNALLTFTTIAAVFSVSSFTGFITAKDKEKERLAELKANIWLATFLICLAIGEVAK